MKKERIITLAVSLMLLTACSEYTGEDTPDGRIPVNLGYTTLTAEEATRTAAATDINDANIATGDKITVKIKNYNAAVSTYADYTYTAAAAGAMTPPSPKPYYPAGSTNIDILAYYPYNAAANFDVAADQTSDANYKASDLMVATKTNQAKTTETVALDFQHKMAKLVVTATAGDGVSKINTITLKQVKRRVSFTSTTGAVGEATEISGQTDVTLFKEGSENTGTGAALIPGQTITGNLIEIATDQGTATYSVPSGKTFNANTKYTISITVNRTAVGTTNSIMWGNEASLTINPTTSELSINDIAAQTYNNGSALKPAFTIKRGNTEVNVPVNTESNYGDFNITWQNNINAGTATVAAVGKSGTSYAGLACAKNFTINKAAQSVTLSTTSLEVGPVGQTGTFTVTRSGDGAVTATSNNTSVATVSVSGTTVTVTAQAVGTATITVKVNEGTNYNAYTADNKTVTVTVPEDPGIAFDNVTSSHKGYYIAQNGKAYSTLALAAQYGTAAVARITYVGRVPGYFDSFLAIALEDASSTTTAVWSTQMSAANTWAQSHAVTISGTTYKSSSTTAYDQVTNGTSSSQVKSSGAVKGWRVPSVTDWKYVFAGIGGKAYDNSAVSDGILYSSGTDSGDSDGSHRALLNNWCGQAWNATTAPQAVQSYGYWSSSERAEYTNNAWYYDFRYSKFYWSNKTDNASYVRAVFAY